LQIIIYFLNVLFLVEIWLNLLVRDIDFLAINIHDITSAERAWKVEIVLFVKDLTLTSEKIV
jgi:hypothetical protein